MFAKFYTKNIFWKVGGSLDYFLLHVSLLEKKTIGNKSRIKCVKLLLSISKENNLFLQQSIQEVNTTIK